MTQRERFLAILIGGLVGVLGMQWAFNKYRAAVNLRHTRVASLNDETARLQEKILQGALAERQMGEYRVRSLPGDLEVAQSDYQKWLFDVVDQHGLQGAKIDPSQSIPVRDLYRRLKFRVAGRTDLPGLTELLHGIYLKDYLHRITDLDIKPNPREGDLTVALAIEAAAINGVPADAKPPTTQSWRVDPSLVAYQDAILNRNFFEPPNQAPQYEGRRQVEAIVDASSQSPLNFTDPEGHSLKYEIVGDAPDFVSLGESDGTLQLNPSAKGEFPLTVRAIDDGYPARVTEQELIVKVSDPPPPPQEPQPEPDFDDAKQTVLTALVQGRDDWTAWMNVRTRGKTLKLRVDDQFEIGTLKGKVVEVNPRYVLIEIDGRRFTLRPAGNLGEAARQALED